MQRGEEASLLSFGFAGTSAEAWSSKLSSRAVGQPGALHSAKVGQEYLYKEPLQRRFLCVLLGQHCLTLVLGFILAAAEDFVPLVLHLDSASSGHWEFDTRVGGAVPHA